MKTGQASRTARLNALFRAIESNRFPRNQRLFDDPWAILFLSPLEKAYVYLSRLPLIGKIVTLYIDMGWPGVRTSALGRTCWIDDQLRNALQDGIRQIVILGAGYDSRAYRIANMAHTHVFEVDHPNTITIKMNTLSKYLDAIPPNIAYVEVNFDHQDLMEELLKSGFNHHQPTFFLLEGVLHYLEADAVDSLFRSIHGLCAPRGKFVFTYIHRGLMDGSSEFGNMGRVSETLKKAGEVWKFGLLPEELPSFLERRGFKLLSDVSATDYRARYMGPRGRHLKGFEFYRAACAQINVAALK